MNTPRGIAVDSSGNLYVADLLNLRVRKITSSGTISTVAGNGILSYSGDGGTATKGSVECAQRSRDGCRGQHLHR